MNSKLLRVITLLLQILVISICLTICVYGIVVIEDPQDTYPYIAATVRVSILLLITISYYKTSVSAFNPGNLFMMMAMLYMSVTELKILSYFTGLTGWSILPPRVSVRLQLFSQFMLYFSLAGYALFYQNNEHSSTTRFNALGTVAMLFLAVTIPSTQDIDGVWSKRAPLSILVVIASIALITFLIILINEQSKAAIVRLIGLMLMMMGNFATVISPYFIYYAAGSAIFFIGGFMVMVVTLRNSVIL
ncbi:MAG: hypothetical protein ILP16_04025 [Spirochaetales bacterium]|nr:hypothetical protein [Spirochaetales bacterium]